MQSKQKFVPTNSPMEIRPYDYSGRTVRIIMDKIGNPLWIGKDVCVALGFSKYRDVLSNLDSDERVSIPVDTPGGKQEMIAINEPGLYRLLSHSNKKRAKKFQRWVFHDVLPQLRKTGFYEITPSDQKTLCFIQTEAEAGIKLANTFGFEGNQALLSANMAMKNIHEIDCLELMGTVHLIADDNEIHLTPTQIGKELGNMTARKVNKILEAKGFQRPIRDTEGRIRGWEPKVDGLPMAIMKDTGKKHSDGTPVQQLFWKKSILSLLEL